MSANDTPAPASARPRSLAGRLAQQGFEPSAGPVPAPAYAGRALVMRGQLRRRRTWPGDDAEVLVRPGDRVHAGEVIARLNRPGRATAVDAGAALGIGPNHVAMSLLQRVGGMVADGDLLAERRTLGGLQRRVVQSPVSGRLSYVSTHHGTVFIEPVPVERQVLAHLPGRVIDAGPNGVTIEGPALAVYGVAGAGPAVVARLLLAETPALLPAEASDAVVASAFPLDEAAILALTEAGAVGVIAPGIDEAAVQRLGWDDFLWSQRTRWGPRAAPPLTVVLLGLGPVHAPSGLWDALRPLAGRPASALGAENGAPAELLVGLGDAGPAPAPSVPAVARGTPVRLAAGRAQGAIGEVVDLRLRPFRLGSEVSTEVAQVALPDGTRLHAPLTHLQILP